MKRCYQHSSMKSAIIQLMRGRVIREKASMKRILAILTMSVALLFSVAAQAQDFPDWPLSATCNTSNSHCPGFEARARGEVSGVWATLPPKLRTQCLGEVKALQPSYRLLNSCLAIAMQEHLRDQHRKPPTGKVVHKTPMAKRPEPPAPPPPAPLAEPAPQAAPVAPAPPQ
jgi:hypothetical protein